MFGKVSKTDTDLDLNFQSTSRACFSKKYLQLQSVSGAYDSGAILKMTSLSSCHEVAIVSSYSLPGPHWAKSAAYYHAILFKIFQLLA